MDLYSYCIKLNQKFNSIIFLINQYEFVLDVSDIQVGSLFNIFVRKYCLAKRNRGIELIVMVLYDCILCAIIHWDRNESDLQDEITISQWLNIHATNINDIDFIIDILHFLFLLFLALCVARSWTADLLFLGEILEMNPLKG